MNVVILLFDGFDELDAIGPFETFENAANAGADIDVALCTLAEAERVTAGHGLRVEPDAVLADESPDLLLVPGGGWTDPESPGVRREYDDGAIPDAIANAHADGVTVASVCTGAMLLAKAGILQGRPAATHHDAAADLQNAGAHAQDARVVDDGDVLTCGGVTAGLDLALYIVANECGDDVATAVAREMEYEPSDDVARTET
jgi:transcriptional regulator GlxA family with amidase domain